MTTPVEEQLPFFVYGEDRPTGSEYPDIFVGRTISEVEAQAVGCSLYGGRLTKRPSLIQDEEGTATGTLITVNPEAYDEVMSKLSRANGFVSAARSYNTYVRRGAFFTTPERPVLAWVFVKEGREAERVKERQRLTRDGDWIRQRDTGISEKLAKTAAARAAATPVVESEGEPLSVVIEVPGQLVDCATSIVENILDGLPPFGQEQETEPDSVEANEDETALTTLKVEEDENGLAISIESTYFTQEEAERFSDSVKPILEAMFAARYLSDMKEDYEAALSESGEADEKTRAAALLVAEAHEELAKTATDSLVTVFRSALAK